MKQDIIASDHMNCVQQERKLLQELENPFIPKLQWAFQSEDRIILVLPFYEGGDLYKHLLEVNRMSEDRVKFYAA